MVLLVGCGAKSGIDAPEPCDTADDCPVVAFCGAVPRCLEGYCALGPIRSCDDATACTDDRCDPALGACVNTLRDADGDGFADASCGGDDCDDSDATIHPGVAERCMGGRDEECDGRTDCSDLDCADDPYCISRCEPERCDNGVDDDCDDIVDCDDSDCRMSPDCCRDMETACGDAVDDDCDGLVDCLDPDCASAPSCCVASPEICNGLDDDCDGAPDDGIGCYFLDGVPIEAIRTSECGSEWYAYGRPDNASANPEPDVRRSDAVVVVLHEGPPGCGTGLAVIADQTRDGEGGELRGAFSISPPDVGGMLVNDDPTAGGGECSYDPTSGDATCDWRWVACCTDGVMFGLFERDFCVTVRLTAPTGVFEILVQDGRDATRSRRFGESFSLCGQLRPAVDI